MQRRFSVGAGAMIMAVEEDKAQLVLETLKSKGVKATAVGRFVNKRDGMSVLKNGSKKQLQHPGTDPYWKAFYEAFAKGLK